MLYFILGGMFLSLGIYSLISKTDCTLLFLLLASIFPSSFAYSDLYSLSGIDVYDYYFFCFLPYFLFFIIKGKIEYARQGILVLIVILIIYFVLSIIKHNSIDKYLLRDLRLLLLPLFVFSFHPYKTRYSIEKVEKVTAIHALMNLIYFALTFIGYFSYKNEYYEANSFRYFGIAGYISCIYLIWMHSKIGYKYFFYNNFSKICYVLCWVTVVLAGYRMLLVSVICAILFSTRFTLKNVILFISVGICGIWAFLLYSTYLNVDRVVGNLDLESIQLQLLTRYGPALEYFQDFTIFNLIWGFGLGTTFEIPWFAYMGLDTKHNRVDSTYLTLFIKMGLFSITYYFAFFKYILKTSANKNFSKGMLVFFLLYMITSPLIYHAYLTIAILYFVVLSEIKPKHEIELI